MFNLLVATGTAAVIGLVAARTVFPSATPSVSASTTQTAIESQIYDEPVPSPSATYGYATAGKDRHLEYAVGLHELRGLPLDAAPGTALELWVAWDDAYAKGPQVQKLVRSVTLSRFIEPVTPEGPIVAVLSVPEKALRAVMYGDLYGSFSVAKPAG